MTIDKDKLKQDIEAMKIQLASMEQELSKTDICKHFPSEGEDYYVLCSNGATLKLIADSDELLVNTYKTKQEVHKAYDKAVALENVKRRLLELQGDWKPDWLNEDEEKICITYDRIKQVFMIDCWYTREYPVLIPYIGDRMVANTILYEMQSELKVIFDVNLK